MSEATLTSLLENLCGALTPSNRRWIAEHLIECTEAKGGENKKSNKQNNKKQVQSWLN